MAHDEKPLPRPPRSPFGHGRPAEREDAEPLTADRMAAAQAQGRLEEFLARELPDSPHARDLAAMMLGLTGLGPGPAAPSPPATAQDEAGPSRPEASAVPADVIAAAGRGDVGGVVEALRREHARRTPEAPPAEPGAAAPAASPPAEAPRAEAPAPGGIDRETLDALLRIAADNGVTPDWLVFRAVRLYVEEHRKTGRL